MECLLISLVYTHSCLYSKLPSKKVGNRTIPTAWVTNHIVLLMHRSTYNQIVIEKNLDIRATPI